MADPEKTGTSASQAEAPDQTGAISPGTTKPALSVPSKDSGRRSPRTVSKTEFARRLAGQMELLEDVLDMAESVPSDQTQCSHSMLNDLLHLMDEHYGQFSYRHYAFV